MNARQATTAMISLETVLSHQLPLNSAPLFVAEVQEGVPAMAILINSTDEGGPDRSDPGVPVRCSSLYPYLRD